MLCTLVPSSYRTCLVSVISEKYDGRWMEVNLYAFSMSMMSIDILAVRRHAFTLYRFLPEYRGYLIIVIPGVSRKSEYRSYLNIVDTCISLLPVYHSLLHT